jgi:hypothetical protein
VLGGVNFSHGNLSHTRPDPANRRVQLGCNGARPQGSGIGPIIANVFLHYVVDLWVHQWRGRRAAGQVIVSRYSDEMVLGRHFEMDGRQLLADLKDRLEQFGLSLQERKPRLIEFGRFAARERRRPSAWSES